MTLTPYPNDLPVLERVAKEKGYSVAFLVREIVGNWCADRRAEKRLMMPASHYVARNSGDEWEAE